MKSCLSRGKPSICLRLAEVAACAALLSTTSVSCASPGDAAGDGEARVYVLEANPSVRASAVRSAITESGATNLGFVPKGAWRIRATAGQLAAVRKSGLFTAVREYAPSEKGTPVADAAPAIYVVTPFKDADAAAVRAAVAAVPGCEIVSKADEMTLRVRMTQAGFQEAAKIKDIQSISRWFEPKLHSEDFKR